MGPLRQMMGRQKKKKKSKILDKYIFTIFIPHFSPHLESKLAYDIFLFI